MWSFLRHPNILPLIGVSMSENRFAMVSKWMTNGNINQFVRVHPETNRFKLVRLPSVKLPCLFIQLEFPQLEDVAKGLIYLHSNGMVHGDLKGVRPFRQFD